MFKDIKLGDDVWDVRYGWGKVVELTKSAKYPFSVEFLNVYENKQNCSYQIDGKAAEWHNFPLLFWNEFKVPAEAFIKPLPKLEVDTKVWVWDKDFSTKVRRHFYEFNENGLIRTYAKGATSFSTDMMIETWPNWELYKEQQC